MAYFLSFYFLLFIIYSFLGWFVEVINVFLNTKKLVNRGFLLGLYCPIYGVGCLAMIFLLDQYLEEPAILFLVSMFLFSVLEYGTSWLMEKLFRTRWWDYSHKKFNLNGRVCLETMIPFGLGGLVVMYLIQPFLNHYLQIVPPSWLIFSASLIFLGFFTDIIISLNIAFNFRATISKLKMKDSTLEVTTYVKNWLKRHPLLNWRLLQAFPTAEIRFRHIRKKLNQEIQELKNFFT